MNTALRRALTAGALLAVANFAPRAQAQTTLSYYNFNTSGAASGDAAPDSFASSTSNGTLTITGFGTAAGSTPGHEYLTGTTVNALNSDASGLALGLLGGTGATGAGTGGNNGGSISFTTNTLGFTGVNISFAIQTTGTGFKTDQFQYSTNGGVTFTNFGSAFTPQSSFSPFATPPGTATVFDLSGVAGVANNPLDVFRITFNGATGSTGNNRLDNLVVSGTSVVPAPEPSGTASLLVGAALIGGMLARTRRRTQAA